MYKVVIGIPIKNCSKTLKNLFKNIEVIISIFKEYVIIFSVDNCRDNSLQLLENYKNNNNVIIVKNENNNSVFRTHRIAKARNSILNIIYNKYSHFEFFIMMDGDDVCSGKININVLEKYIKTPYLEKWDCLTFNRNFYYDIWALQYGVYNYHCWGWGIDSWKVVGLMRSNIKKTLSELPENEDLLECISAFNGFAIYKTKKFNKINYSGLPEKNIIQSKYKNCKDSLEKSFKKGLVYKNYFTNQTCEHINFHVNASKINNAKIFISKNILFEEYSVNKSIRYSR